MKLGEIKLQALMMIFPSEVLEYDEDSIQEVIFNLKSSTSYSPYLAMSCGAINRGFSVIEQRGIGELDCFHLNLLSGKREGEYIVFDISEYSDISKIKNVYLSLYDIRVSLDFYLVGKYLYIKTQRGSGDITIEYLKKLPRITHATDDLTEINLPYGIESFIPYFVKADLLLGENYEESEASRLTFEKLLDSSLAFGDESTQFNSVYRVGSVR